MIPYLLPSSSQSSRRTRFSTQMALIVLANTLSSGSGQATGRRSFSGSNKANIGPAESLWIMFLRHSSYDRLGCFSMSSSLFLSTFFSQLKKEFTGTANWKPHGNPAVRALLSPIGRFPVDVDFDPAEDR